MATAHEHGDEEKSLLQLVESAVNGEEDIQAVWDAVLSWFKHSASSEAQEKSKETNACGETALHIILKDGAYHQQQQLVMIEKLVRIKSDAFKILDFNGYLPLHKACLDRTCSFEVIQALIMAYPEGLGVMSPVMKHTPFHWDYNGSLGRHFTDFLQYVMAIDVHSSGSRVSTLTMRKNRHTLLCHCKNNIPLDILKKGMLNEKTLESRAMIRWLNEMPCKRAVVCSMMFELYLHLAWIFTFIHTTRFHFKAGQQLQNSGPIALLIFAALFFIQEFYQMYRFFKTNAAIAYWLDPWNWIDLTTAGLVAASAIKFMSAIKFIQEDKSVPSEDLIIATGFFQFVLFISYLKKTFFPFSKFVSGVIKIFWALFPFLVISVTTLFAFSFMYWVQEKKDYEAYYDPFSHNSTNPYESLIESFKTVYSPFASGPEGNEGILDYLFGITIVIVLLNVVIAIVTEAWEDAAEEANEAFWNYRLDLILEKTRGIDEQRILRTAIFGCKKELDDFFINIETVGTTTDELKKKLAMAYREEGVLVCIVIISKSLAFVILGFPTFGILWPKFFRQILFTPPKPKEDETKVQIEQLAAEIEECKKVATEGVKSFKKLESDVAKLTEKLESDVAKLSEKLESDAAKLSEKLESDAAKLSEKMNLQVELMQQLLGKDAKGDRATTAHEVEAVLQSHSTKQT